LNLYNSRQLDPEQVQAIVDLVTGSVPNLQASRVTVTDQFGRLLHSGSMSLQERETTRELKITREQQNDYRQKIEQILLPIVGEGNYTVQVTVEMDFTKTEQTQQMFNPELPAVRSERTLEDESVNGRPTGVPGALSNQPPAASTIPETLQQNASNSIEESGPKNRRVEAERNYDLDTTISHVKQQVGVIKKVSVSVGLDYIENPQDPTARIPRSDEQIANIERLVRGAIGYNANRGDVVEIQSFEFVRPDNLPEPEPLPFYEQPLFKALWKPVTALILGLLLIFGVLKPVMNKLSRQPEIKEVKVSDEDIGLGDLKDDTLSLENDAALELPQPNAAGSKKIEQAKAIAGQDPTMVAQLVKNWVEQDE
jgi:flagellar M-ring protein FliF